MSRIILVVRDDAVHFFVSVCIVIIRFIRKIVMATRTGKSIFQPLAGIWIGPACKPLGLFGHDGLAGGIRVSGLFVKRDWLVRAYVQACS